MILFPQARRGKWIRCTTLSYSQLSAAGLSGTELTHVQVIKEELSTNGWVVVVSASNFSSQQLVCFLWYKKQQQTQQTKYQNVYKNEGMEKKHISSAVCKKKSEQQLTVLKVPVITCYYSNCW